MVSRILYFYPFLNLGIWSNLTRAFWNGLNHQLLGLVYIYLYINQYFIKCVVLAFACSMSLESSTTSRKFPRHTWIPNTRYYSIYMAKKKWGTGVTSHKWSYFTLLMNGFWAHLVPKLTKKHHLNLSGLTWLTDDVLDVLGCSVNCTATVSFHCLAEIASNMGYQENPRGL